MNLLAIGLLCALSATQDAVDVIWPSDEVLAVGKRFAFELTTTDAALKLPDAPFEVGSLVVLEHHDFPDDRSRRSYVAMPTLSGRIEVPTLEIARQEGHAGPSVRTPPFTLEVTSARRDGGPEWVDAIELFEPQSRARDWVWWWVLLGMILGVLLWNRRRRRAPPSLAPVRSERLTELSVLLGESVLDPAATVEAIASALRAVISERFGCSAEQRTSEELASQLVPRLRSIRELVNVLEVADAWKYGAVRPSAAMLERVHADATQVVAELRDGAAP